MSTRTIVFWAVAAVAAGGCASTPPSQAETRLEARLEAAPTKGCLPFVPAVALATAVGEALPPPSPRVNDGTGAPDFAYPSAVHFPRAEEAQYVNAGRGTSGFAYPNAYWGCHSWSCR